jgi:hypothetical protein
MSDLINEIAEQYPFDPFDDWGIRIHPRESNPERTLQQAIRRALSNRHEIGRQWAWVAAHILPKDNELRKEVLAQECPFTEDPFRGEA